MTKDERRGYQMSRIILHMAEMSADEIGLMFRKAEKLMTEGRREYGPLDIPTDARSALDFAREMADEAEDTANYAGMLVVKLEQGQ